MQFARHQIDLSVQREQRNREVLTVQRAFIFGDRAQQERQIAKAERKFRDMLVFILSYLVKFTHLGSPVDRQAENDPAPFLCKITLGRLL